MHPLTVIKFTSKVNTERNKLFTKKKLNATFLLNQVVPSMVPTS